MGDSIVPAPLEDQRVQLGDDERELELAAPKLHPLTEPSLLCPRCLFGRQLDMVVGASDMILNSSSGSSQLQYK